MALFAVRLKKEIAKIAPNYQPKLRNVVVNGQKRGCSGFVSNPENGKTVYVNTESSCYQPLSGKALVRYAKSDTDYSGSHNEFVPVERTAEAICKMLASEKSLHGPMERRSAY